MNIRIKANATQHIYLDTETETRVKHVQSAAGPIKQALLRAS